MFVSKIMSFPIHRGKAPRILAGILAGLILAGCTATYEKRQASISKIDLLQPKAEIPEADLLGVRISTFEPGKVAEEDAKERGVSQQIRKAEGYFIAAKLRDTMQKSGHWGPVRVVPLANNNGEISVKGEIQGSDGEVLQVRVQVFDAMGAEWFSKEYSGVVTRDMYDTSAVRGVDAFQFLFNQIANDIAIHRNKLTKSRIARVRQVAELKFAAEFAPDIYGTYLKKKSKDSDKNKSDILTKLFLGENLSASDSPTEGIYEVVRLPAENDPNFRRIQRIRSRENQLIETLDQQYDGLARSIQGPYTQWRKSRLTEMNAVRKVEKLENERAGKAIAAGLLGAALIVAGSGNSSCAGCNSVATSAGTLVLGEAIKEAVALSKDAGADLELHKIALEELGQSLVAEVSPVVVEVEGEVIELRGSVEEKFMQWQKLMRRLHAQELGLLNKTSQQPPEGDATNG